MLILEDDEGNRHYLQMLFRNDYNIVEAGDIDTALDELRKPDNNDIAIIIADKKLENVSGIQVSGIQFLKESKERFPYAIRVLYTAYPDIKDYEMLINDIRIDLIYFKPLLEHKANELKIRLKTLLIEKGKIKNALEI